ncbi:DUF6584 family protein [Streptomyces liangshanensis]|uniref:Uncharacterized protein n=1 Tax=Streptomyces liangshanensis TaxID=2717324 RepID=A0A6G9GXH4_9ACTN|nr:DUF6584 family protein [Streptomyces liangshanensis]QIQ02756.1 hypothetical protein HA039_10885 [Streptomyces liangshanensis]
MAPTDTLARVEADLVAGRIPLARQRLRGLVSSYPYDLTLRRRLADVYRLYGDRAEAGRWAYLDEDRDAGETAAFEARYADPERLMRALAWQGPEALAASAFAVAQLAAVRTACSAAFGRPVDWDSVPTEGRDDPHGDARPFGLLGKLLLGGGCLLVVLVVSAVWVYGFVHLFGLFDG